MSSDVVPIGLALTKREIERLSADMQIILDALPDKYEYALFIWQRNSRNVGYGAAKYISSSEDWKEVDAIISRVRAKVLGRPVATE